MTLASKKKKIFDGRYEVLSIVGRGSCSVVYHARHAMTQSSEVALKVLLNQKKGSDSNTDRLRKEALAMVSSRHKYVVRLDDFHSVKELCYLSMEYAKEGDLRKYSAKLGGKLPHTQAEMFFIQSAEALNFVHRVGITHRDIKPDNILVMNDREIRLADFGVAVLPGEHASLEDLRSGVGTMSYMAPEVLEGRLCDKLSDMYSLAVTFYEMLSGVHPFENAPLIKQLEVRENKNITPIQKLVPGLSKNVAEAIMKAMSYDPATRFANMSELLKAIGKPGTQTPNPGSRPPAPQGRKESDGRNRPTPPNRPTQQTPTAKPNQAQRPAGKFQAKVTTPAAEQNKIVAAKREVTKAPPAQPTPGRLVKESSPQPQPAPIQPNAKTADSQSRKELAPKSANKVPTSQLPSAASNTAPELMNEVDDLISDDDIFDFSEPTDTPSTQKPLINNYEIPEENLEVEEYREDPYYNSRPETKPSNVKDYKKDYADIPKKTRSPASRDKSGSPFLFNLIILAMICFAGDYVLKKFAGIDILSYLNQTRQEDYVQNTIDVGQASDLIPAVTETVQNFPQLPAGMYSGSISGLLPDGDAPLTIISFPEINSLAFVIGVDGWSPNAVSYLERKKGTDGQAIVSKMRVASNGIVLDIEGQVDADQISGKFTNAISGASGTWKVNAVN